MRRLFTCFLFLLLLLSATCFAQQTDIRQFAAYSAFTYLSTPSLNLYQRGFNGDFGVNLRPWLTMGFDFGTYNGNNSLVPSYLNPTLAALLPPIPGLYVPGHATTYTYEAGPQLNYRHFKHLTLFVRPALGALHMNWECTSTDPLTQLIVKGLTGGSLGVKDTVVFYGFGGGATWEITPNFGIRVASDFVRFNVFSDTLNGPRNSVRVSIGTKFGFGKNIVANK